MSASYPSATRSFTTKLDGPSHTISASHINDPQDEIVAIENGLLTALQHDLKFTDATFDIGKTGATRPRDLFLSRDATVGRNATVAGTLGVTGITTLSDDVKVAASKKVYLDGGGNTYAIESAADTVDVYTNAVRALTIDSTQFIDSPTQPRASAYNSAVQSINDVTATALTLDTEDYDVGGLHSIASATSKMTVPTGGDGFYQITGLTTFAAGTSGARQLFLRKNGTTSYPGFTVTSAAIVGAVVHFSLPLVATDYMELMATQNSGGAMNVGGATRDGASTLQMVKLW